MTSPKEQPMRERAPAIRERKRKPASRRRSQRALAQTTMSPSLPSEILDLIIIHLHDKPTALKACCVASKSWVQRTRIHLFASVEFCAQKSPIERWKKTFPDPSNSPAHHTRRLTISGIPVVTAADTDAGGWIRTFHNIVHLHLEFTGSEDPRVSLTPFRGLSPTLKSLHLSCTSPEVLDLICSFPLLEDLALTSLQHGSDTWNTPSTSPKLTGSLDLSLFGGIRTAICRLVGLPGGLHFTKISIACLQEDVESTKELVSRCSGTLEYLSIYYYTPGMSPFSLSKSSIPYHYSRM
jgi:hypothetical protein